MGKGKCFTRGVMGNSPLIKPAPYLIRGGVRGVLFLCVICVIGVICGSVFADNWSQTTFPAGTGTFSNTAPANANNDVTLLAVGLANPVGTDHGGADWTPANGSSIDSGHYNIGTFTIAAGTTVYVTAGISLTVYANYATIAGTLNATGRGYGGGAAGAGASGAGPGGGGGTWNTGAGGGGYGGAGGAGGGGTYGSPTTPNDFGSGGGSANANFGGGGGAGGGLVQLYISGTLTITGSITTNGNNGTNGGSGGGGGGGGSGGGIYLRAGTLAGNGSVNANGGNGGSGTGGAGGGGGGGRIALDYITNTYTGTITVNGGSGGGGAGAIGTISYGFCFANSGTYTSSAVISPNGLQSWGVLTYTITSPTNTTLTVDVLKAIDNSLLGANITSGTNLATIVPSTCYALKLRANFATADTTQTSILSDWSVNYVSGGPSVTTTNWTSLITPGQQVAMGQAIAQAKFTMNTVSGTAHWKRFRVDKYCRAGQQLIDDTKIVVQVWMENNGDGFFDAGDQMLAQGTFTNNTCYLNMNRWAVTTAPKTYYIVYKFDANCGGGQYAGVNITDSSYLEFEEGPCIGVPP